MPDAEIPKRALFKSSEVCEIASVQPYVLRSWEAEFPDLGVARRNGGLRVYRRADVERVLRIKQLVFLDGLTLAGVRRRIEGDAPPALDEAGAAPSKELQELLGRDARERLAEIKEGLRAILELLSARPDEVVVGEFSRAFTRSASRRKPPAARRAKPAARTRRKKARGSASR